MSYKTTKKDFTEFKKEAEYWIEYFGLKRWEFSIIHSEIDHPDATASYSCDPEAMNAYITMATSVNFKPIKNEIKGWAFHEVCHVLLTDMSRILRVECSDNRTALEVHKVIQTLQNTIFKEKRG